MKLHVYGTRSTMYILVSIIQTHRPWTPRRTSGWIFNKKIWRKSEAYRNLGKRFDLSLAIKRQIVMAAPIVETIWLVNGFKSHIVIAASFTITPPSSVQNLMKSSSRRIDGKSRSLDRDYVYICMIQTISKTYCFCFFLTLNCKNLAKQLLPLAMFYNWYLPDLFCVRFV